MALFPVLGIGAVIGLLLFGGGSVSFVKTSGTRLTLANRGYRFVGVNRYNLLTADQPELSSYRGCGTSWHDSELATWFAELRSMGVNAVRFWAFQRFTASGTDWRQLDKIISLARNYNIKIVPVLENQWDDCTEGGYKYSSWYQMGYQQPYGAYPISYKEYVRRIVSRYKSNPTILMWQLMNEAECTTDRNLNSAQDPISLYNFAADMSRYVKSFDSNHLVSLGTMGSGQPGAQGSDYRHLYSIPTIDLLEYHDYGSEAIAMPSDGYNRLAERIQDAVALNKPIFIGESGIKANCPDVDCYSVSDRARYFDAKMQAAFSNRVSGYLIWSYRDNKSAITGWEFGLNDPLAMVVHSYAIGAK